MQPESETAGVCFVYPWNLCGIISCKYYQSTVHWNKKKNYIKINPDQGK